MDPFIKAGFDRLNQIDLEYAKLSAERAEIMANIRAVCPHEAVIQCWEYWSEPGEYGSCGFQPTYTCQLCGLNETGWTPQILKELVGQRTIIRKPAPWVRDDHNY